MGTHRAIPLYRAEAKLPGYPSYRPPRGRPPITSSELPATAVHVDGKLVGAIIEAAGGRWEAGAPSGRMLPACYPSSEAATAALLTVAGGAP